MENQPNGHPLLKSQSLGGRHPSSMYLVVYYRPEQMSDNHQGNSYHLFSPTEGAESERQPDLVSGASAQDGFALTRNIDAGSERHQHHRLNEETVLEKPDPAQHMYQ